MNRARLPSSRCAAVSAALLSTPLAAQGPVDPVFCRFESAPAVPGDSGLAVIGAASRRSEGAVHGGRPRGLRQRAIREIVDIDDSCGRAGDQYRRPCEDNWGELVTAMMSNERASRFNRVAAHANASRVTIFSLDAAGVRGAPFMEARQAPFGT